ncbi:MAG: hypothetical protein OHK0031_17280 [Anaerolineales bacterium]
MINWAEVAISALWLFGLALILAALSLRAFFGAKRQPAADQLLNAGEILFSLGWGLGAASPLERGFWLGAALLLAARLLLSRFVWK